MLVDKTGLPWLKGKLLSWAITSVCSTAFLLFGYDQGVMSGVILSKYWLDQMGNPRTVIVGTIVAVYDVGAVFGAIFAALTAERLGRKRALMAGTLLLIIGSVLMGAAMEQVMIFFGRVFTGFGMSNDFYIFGKLLTRCKVSAISLPLPQCTKRSAVFPLSAVGSWLVSCRPSWLGCSSRIG